MLAINYPHHKKTLSTLSLPKNAKKMTISEIKYSCGVARILGRAVCGAWRIACDSHAQKGVFGAMTRGLAPLSPQIARQRRAVCAVWRIGEAHKETIDRHEGTVV